MRQFFEKFSNIKLNPLNAELNAICYLLALLGAHHILHVNRENLSGGNQVFPCGQMDGRTDMTKLMVAFHNFANAPKKLRRSRNTVGI
jgi:hypothetical protein